jgi:hypothetical protein
VTVLKTVKQLADPIIPTSAYLDPMYTRYFYNGSWTPSSHALRQRMKFDMLYMCIHTNFLFRKKTFRKHKETNMRLQLVCMYTMYVRFDSLCHCQPGLPDFPWYNIPKWGKLYQITTKYTKCPQNITNDHNIDQMSTK